MRIVHVTDFFLPRLGGIEMQVADLAARQAARGDEVTVVTTSRGTPADDPPGVRVVRLTDRQRAVRPLTSLAGAWKVSGMDADVVHCHAGIGTMTAFAGANLAARRGLPVAVTIHSFWHGYGWLWTPFDRLGRFRRLPIAWSAVSEAAAAPVRRLSRHPVSVLPNGTDVDAWRVAREPVRDDDVLLVSVMRLARRKRPLPLLEVLASARRRLPDGVRLRLVVAGDGPAMPAVRERVRALGLADVVELPGRLTRDQICRLYRSADAFVAPAVLESFGIAALEARCAGVPVLARSGTGIAGFVTPGVDGLLAGSDAALADAVLAVAADPALRRRLRGGRPPRQFDWPAVLATTDALYARAGARRAPLPLPLRPAVEVPSGPGEATA